MPSRGFAFDHTCGMIAAVDIFVGSRMAACVVKKKVSGCNFTAFRFTVKNAHTKFQGLTLILIGESAVNP